MRARQALQDLQEKGELSFSNTQSSTGINYEHHKYHLKVDEHTVLSPFYREGNSHIRIKQHSSFDGLKKYRNVTARKEKQASVAMITALRQSVKINCFLTVLIRNQLRVDNALVIHIIDPMYPLF